jgi:hypothetical protein
MGPVIGLIGGGGEVGDVAMTYVCCPFGNTILVGITNGGGGTLG